jgi:hypothetical protein
VGALGWIGVGLIIFGALWALLMWVAETWRPAPAAGPEAATKENPIAAILKAIADLFKSAAELLKLNYGAPALVMLVGLVLVIVDAA